MEQGKRTAEDRRIQKWHESVFPATEAKGCVHFILKKMTEKDVCFIPKRVSHKDVASWRFIQEGSTHIYLPFQIVQEFPELQILHNFK